MKKLLFIVLLFVSCRNATLDKTNLPHILPKLSLKKASFPFQLANVNFNDSSYCVIADEHIQRKIEQTITDYYFDDCEGDSTETYFKIKDTYMGTVQLQNKLQTLFVVVLRHIPSGKVNSKILFYNSKNKKFADSVIDFNIHAMYTIDEQSKLHPSGLKKLLNLKTEIAVVDFDKDGQADYQLTELYHNGSANGIETSIFTLKDNHLKKHSFNLKWN